MHGIGVGIGVGVGVGVGVGACSAENEEVKPSEDKYSIFIYLVVYTGFNTMAGLWPLNTNSSATGFPPPHEVALSYTFAY